MTQHPGVFTAELSDHLATLCAAAFPLSGHAGYDELLRFVELVQPIRVLTLHGFAREFAATLRSRGLDAFALGYANQLEMPLGM